MSRDYFGEDILDNALKHAQQERRAKRDEVKAQRDRAAERKRRLAQKAAKHRRAVFACVIVGVAVLLLVGTTLFKIYELSKEKAEMEARLEELTREKQALQDELSNVESDEYVEQQARSELRMIKEGETLYVVVDDENPESGN